nr:hypothetical protein [Tanacetum cinerariifolium]
MSKIGAMTREEDRVGINWCHGKRGRELAFIGNPLSIQKWCHEQNWCHDKRKIELALIGAMAKRGRELALIGKEGTNMLPSRRPTMLFQERYNIDACKKGSIGSDESFRLEKSRRKVTHHAAVDCSRIKSNATYRLLEHTPQLINGLGSDRIRSTKGPQPPWLQPQSDQKGRVMEK